MTVSCVLTPAEIALLPEADLTETTAVVFDILRATSTMSTAFASGAAAIYPAKDIVEALALKEKHPSALLGGERHGEKIAGFDLGNSPLEYRDLAGREIISTTTNGTVAIRAVTHARRVVVASLLNLSATAQYLRTQSVGKLLLVCAGTGRDFAVEDGIAAGALLECFCQEMHPADTLDDAGRMLLALWKSAAPDLETAFAQSKNGSRLIQRQRSAEVSWCAQRDIFQTVGVLSGAALLPLRLGS